jgi:hypothetical protein
MKTNLRSVLAIAALLAVSAAPALAADVTVGQFVQELARAKKLNATDARVAVDSLRTVGVRLPSDLKLSDRLTEAEVVRISRSVGLLVSTANPEAPFDDEQMDRFFDVFGVELAVKDNDDPIGGETLDPTFDPWTKGKGNHYGHHKYSRSPTEPE